MLSNLNEFPVEESFCIFRAIIRLSIDREVESDDWDSSKYVIFLTWLDQYDQGFRNMRRYLVRYNKGDAPMGS